MIYRAIQLIQIFLADGREDERTKVIQEVLADLKSVQKSLMQSVRGEILQLDLKEFSSDPSQVYIDVQICM